MDAQWNAQAQMLAEALLANPQGLEDFVRAGWPSALDAFGGREAVREGIPEWEVVAYIVAHASELELADLSGRQMAISDSPG